MLRAFQLRLHREYYRVEYQESSIGFENLEKMCKVHIVSWVELTFKL